jgi:hypothetical protein
MLKLIERRVYVVGTSEPGLAFQLLLMASFLDLLFMGSVALFLKKICYEEVNIGKKRKAKAVKGYYRRPGEVARTEWASHSGSALVESSDHRLAK